MLSPKAGWALEHCPWELWAVKPHGYGRAAGGISIFNRSRQMEQNLGHSVHWPSSLADMCPLAVATL